MANLNDVMKSNVKRCVRVAALLALVVSAVAKQANAVPLAPGGVVGTPGTSVGARPELAGGVIEDVIRPFSVMSPTGAVLMRGWMQDRVVREGQNGTLDFY